jgi:hypothetical protein
MSNKIGAAREKAASNPFYAVVPGFSTGQERLECRGEGTT